jgi:hypothetical protein
MLHGTVVDDDGVGNCFLHWHAAPGAAKIYLGTVRASGSFTQIHIVALFPQRRYREQGFPDFFLLKTVNTLPKEASHQKTPCQNRCQSEVTTEYIQRVLPELIIFKRKTRAQAIVEAVLRMHQSPCSPRVAGTSASTAAGLLCKVLCSKSVYYLLFARRWGNQALQASIYLPAG